MERQTGEQGWLLSVDRSWGCVSVQLLSHTFLVRVAWGTDIFISRGRHLGTWEALALPEAFLKTFRGSL